ncbi:MAG: helix-turn-helix transcriptional regulator [Devosia sp.]
MAQQLLTADDVAKRLRVSRRAFFALRARTIDFPRAVRLGARTVRYKESDVDEWVASRVEED